MLEQKNIDRNIQIVDSIFTSNNFSSDLESHIVSSYISQASDHIAHKKMFNTLKKYVDFYPYMRKMTDLKELYKAFERT